jgi:long-chain fatty acid transport protein
MKTTQMMVAGAWMALGAATSFGAGFQLYTEGSTEALGQAAAISGRTNLTSLAWYNPAALAGTDSPRLMAGVTFASIHTDFTSHSNALYDASMDDHWQPIPHLYYIHPLSTDLTAMLSINAPYGLITEWDEDWAGSDTAIHSGLATLYTTPSLAYKVTDALSLAAGVNIVYCDAELTATRGPFGTRKVTGDDLGYGYALSGHYQLQDWGFGIRYQSRVKLEPEGSVTFDNNPLGGGTRFDAKGYLDLPATVNMGIANSSINNLSLGLDVIWTEWSSYNQLKFAFGSDYPLTNPDIAPKNWSDVWSIRLGADYQLTKSWALRAGYVWDQSPVEEAYRAPELPDSDRQMLMTGLGWSDGKWGIDLAYAFLWAEEAETGSQVVSKVPASAGRYKTTTHLIALSGSYHF